MKQQRIFKIRDLRQKEKFVVDDLYLDEYAKIIGTAGTLVYFSLCRYANKDQEAWPAQETIATKLGISVRSVREGLKRLKEINIIDVDRERTEKGKWLNNIYILLDKSQWKQPEAARDLWISQRQKTTKTRGSQRPTKETHIKETHNMSDKPTDWNLEKEIEKLKQDKRRHIQIIGLWIKEMNFRPENKEQIQSIINRNLRPANLLKGYKDEDIINTIKTLKNTDYLHGHFGIETITKYIDSIVANKKTGGAKIIKWQEIRKPNGEIFMKPIYKEDLTNKKKGNIDDINA